MYEYPGLKLKFWYFLPIYWSFVDGDSSKHLLPPSNTVKLGYIKLGFYEYMVYIEVLQRPERNPIDFHVK